MKTLLRLMGIAIAISCALAAYGGDFSGRDAADVRNVLDAYVAAWLSGNQEAVMRLLTPDSVLIPGEKAPFIGRAAIRGYWWPAGSPPFALRRFTTTRTRSTAHPASRPFAERKSSSGLPGRSVGGRGATT